MFEGDNNLFCGNALSDLLAFKTRESVKMVEAIPKEQFLSTHVDAMVENIVSQMTVESLKIYEEQITRDEPQETKLGVTDVFLKVRVEVPGVRINIYLPFDGNPELWHHRPNTMGCNFPTGTVFENKLRMIFEQRNQDAKCIEKDIKDNLKLIKEYISWQKDAINNFNINLYKNVCSKIEERRKNLENHGELAKILNIPLRRNPSAPDFKPIHLQKKVIKPLPPTLNNGDKKEWGISDQEYESILNIIRHVGRSFETTPQTYSVHCEEDLRDIVLSHLNAVYMGDATGETFRKAGKTDIRIEAEDRSAFVAECKVWNGQKTISDSIDQLLDYLTWRDCKAAVIIFNKDIAGFTEIVQKVKPALESHLKLNKIASCLDRQAEWSCIFRSKDDDARLIHLHIFMFNLYTKEKNNL